jgi:hypothetical protein
MQYLALTFLTLCVVTHASATNSIVITAPGNSSNADQHTDLSVTVTYASGAGGYQTPTWAYRLDSGFPGYGSPHGGNQVTGVTNVNDFLSGQSNGMRQVNVALLDQNGDMHNPPIVQTVSVNYQSGGGGYQSGGGDTIVITAPGNGSNADQHTDLSVTVTYASGGGGYQTPTWAYRLDSGFPGYGSPHGGTQVTGSTTAWDFLSGQANGNRQVNVALLDQGGNLHNPPIVQIVSVNYQLGGNGYQSGGGGYQSGGGGYQSGGGGYIAYSGPYQSPTGDFRTDTRNALFDDFIEFKNLQSVGKLKFDYNTSTYFNQSIDELIDQLIVLPIPPSTSRGDAVDAWIAQNFDQANGFDHHMTIQAFDYTVVGNIDLNKSSELKSLASNHGTIYFQVYFDQNVSASGQITTHSIWALSVENGTGNRSNLMVDMAGKVYNGDFNSYWLNTHGIETWDSNHWHETSYSTSSAGIDSLLLAHPVIFDPTAEVHTIKPFDFMPDGQVNLSSTAALAELAKDHKKIFFQTFYFDDHAHEQGDPQEDELDPLELIAGQDRDQGMYVYQSSTGGYQSSGGDYQSGGSGYQPTAGFVPYTGPYASPTYDFKIDTRNALFDDHLEFIGLGSVTKLKADYNTTKEFNDSLNTLIAQLQTLVSPPSTARGDAIDHWIAESFDLVGDLDPNHEPAFAWALSIEEADGNRSDLVVDMFGNVYEADFESYWLSVYGVPTHNDPNWSEIEYNVTTEGIAKLYQDHPFIDPGIIMETMHKLAVLETDTPQNQGNVIQLSGSLLETNGTDVIQIGFLVSSHGHPFVNDPYSQVILATTQNSLISASYTVPSSGVYYVRSFAETKGGISEGPVRKIDIFLDDPQGNDPQATALSIIRQDTIELAGGWRQSHWFGLYLDHGNGWIYHQVHGWLYMVHDGQNGIWTWHQQRGWLWTSQDLYPYLYQAGTASWLYLLGIVDGQAVFFNYGINSIDY